MPVPTAVPGVALVAHHRPSPHTGDMTHPRLMRRPRLLVLTLLLVAAGTLSAQSFGGGISVFVPWDMLEGETGSISFETSLETSLGLGDYLSIPVGFSYNQVYGMGAVGTLSDISTDPDAALETSGPWFYADSLLPYLLLKANVPLGPVYLDLYGGGALNYNFSLRPFTDRISRDLQATGAFGASPGTAAITDITIDSGIGWGWIAGAGFGVQIDQIRVGLDVSYRYVVHPLTVTADYVTSSGTGVSTVEADQYVDQLRAVLQGLSIGIGGSFSM